MLYLVDASVYIFRAYYSMPVEMADRDGNPAQAVVGFARFIADLLERAQPRYIAVAFDESLASSFRSRLYPAYKANRERAPVELKVQFARCRQFCELLGVAAFSSPEYEADDVVGTLACRMRREGVNATLVTRDKDLAQLVRPGDVWWDWSGPDRYGYEHIEERFGVLPERYADYLALTGDAVDNIRGVPGIGPKTASQLLREFASLEEIYAGLERIPALKKIRQAGTLPGLLREHREAAFLARQLTAIACDMPLDVQPGHLRPRTPDVAGLETFCDHHRFGPLLRRQVERIAQLAAA